MNRTKDYSNGIRQYVNELASLIQAERPNVEVEAINIRFSRRGDIQATVKQTVRVFIPVERELGNCE